MAELRLVNSELVALVDDEDFEMLSRWRWHENGDYVAGTVREVRRAPLLLHRFLMAPPRGMVVDHINHNGLDNRRSNLRVCTQAQNVMNRRVPSVALSGFRGVHSGNGRWIAVCAMAYLGQFDDPAEAARAYDTAARAKYGEFATLNFPMQQRVA